MSGQRILPARLLPARRHTIIKTIINHHQMCHPTSRSGN
jgi:hypothetical protein